MDETLNELGEEWRRLIEYKEGTDNINKLELIKSLVAVHPKICKNGLSLLCIDTLVSVLEKLGDSNEDTDLSLEVLKNLIPNEPLTNEYAHRLIMWFLSASYRETSASSYFTYWLLVCVKIGVINKELVQKSYFKPLMFSFLKNIPDNAMSHLLQFLSNHDSININFLRQLVEIYNRENHSIKKKHLAVLLKYYFQILPVYTQNHENLKCKKVVAPMNLSLKDKSWTKVMECIVSINSVKKSKLNLTKIIQSLNVGELEQIETDHYFGLSPAYNNNSKGVRLSSLTSLQDIVKYYHCIVPPTNILAVLQHKCGHLYIRFSSPSWVTNLEEQVGLILTGILNNSLHPIIIHDKFLEALVAVQDVCCESFLSVSNFLKKYIIKWDTVKYRGEIVRLIPWLHFTSVDDLKDTMANLFTVFTSADLKCRVLLLNALFQLYINLMIIVNHRIPSGSHMHYKPPNWMRYEPHQFFSLYIDILDMFVKTGLLFHDSSPALLSEMIVGYHNIFVTENKFNFKLLNQNNTFVCTVLPTPVVLMCHTSTCITVFGCLLTVLSGYWDARESMITSLNRNFYPEYEIRYEFIEKYTRDTLKILFSGMDFNKLEGTLISQLLRNSDKKSFKKLFSQVKGLLSMTENIATSHIVYELAKKIKINLTSIQPEKYLDLLEYFAPRANAMVRKLSTSLDAWEDIKAKNETGIE